MARPRRPPARLRIAMIGQRGVPATFGGIERHVEEVGARLAARGHEVTVYCRTNYARGQEPEYRGMRLVRLPTVGTKHLDAVVHSTLSTGAAMVRRPDVVHYHALGPGLLAFLPRALSSSGVVLTVHGLDHQRAKWGSGARAVLRAGEWLSARVPDATIVVSRALADHYRSRHRREPWVVPNGVEPRPGRLPREIVSRLGLRPRSYLLFVGRLVPEKAPDLLIRAFRRVPGDVRLVIAGGSSFTDGFVRGLGEQAAGDRRVVLAGYVYGSLLEELYSNAAAFVLPSTVEGLPLTLLEAASYGTPIVASDIPPHREVLGADRPGARTFPPGDVEGLVRVLGRVLGDLPGERRGGAILRRAVVRRYGWDQAVDALERVYRTVVR